jgi:hypothetical protein
MLSKPASALAGSMRFTRPAARTLAARAPIVIEAKRVCQLTGVKRNKANKVCFSNKKSRTFQEVNLQVREPPLQSPIQSNSYLCDFLIWNMVVSTSLRVLTRAGVPRDMSRLGRDGHRSRTELAVVNASVFGLVINSRGKCVAAAVTRRAGQACLTDDGFSGHST